MTYTITNHLLNVHQHPSPNHGGEITPEIIVMHHTAGWPDGKGSVSWLCNPDAKASAHLVINHDGEATQLVPFNLRAWHAGASSSRYNNQLPNDIGIGVELANPGRLVKRDDGRYEQRGNSGMVFSDKDWDIRWFEAPWDKGHFLAFSDKQLLAATEIGTLLARIYTLTAATTHQCCDPTRKMDPHPGYNAEAYSTAIFADVVWETSVREPGEVKK